MLVDEAEITARKTAGLPDNRACATPWQRIYRETVTQLDEGATIKGAYDFQRISRSLPRHKH